jgi:polar amino acid transport system substrate-binding protein
MKRLLIMVTILSLMTLLMAGCAKEDDVLRVGMELKYPPFETIDKDGNPTGASVRLAEALGEHLGREIEIVDTPYKSLIPSLNSGTIDVIISSMTITPIREESVDFSDPYTSSQLMMLVHKDSIVESHEDLDSEDVTIASKAGTIGALWAADNAPNAKISTVEEEATAVLEVSQGNADVFIYDPLSIIRHQSNYPDTTLAILDPLPNTKGWGIAMRKGEDDLRSKVNEFIKKAKTDGTYDAIREEFLKDKVAEFEEYGLDFFF